MNWKMHLYMIFALLVIAGCSTSKDLAQSTRTGKIHDVRIGETLDPKELQVRVGDEVRWVNARNAPVRIVFIDSLQDKVACQKEFALKARTTSSKIGANDYSSLCFMLAGSYTYNARMESPVPGGEINTIGRIYVE